MYNTNMKILTNVNLAPYTSLNCGGPAEVLVIVNSRDELLEYIQNNHVDHILGYGTNSLISDNGLPGTTLIINSESPEIIISDTIINASAGTWWDDVVNTSIDNDLWGIELMSGIPSSVGAAICGNIAAYGQSISQTLVSVEVYNTTTDSVETLEADELGFGYRTSNFSRSGFSQFIIVSASFRLTRETADHLDYSSAQHIADEINIPPNTLQNRHQIILEARARSGSLYELDATTSQHHSAGSFFKNPIVSEAQVESIIEFEEKSSINRSSITKQNAIHGGRGNRVSAAHVMLAAGFNRSQSWGPVRLHPEHILKLENTGGATAKQIHDVAHEIITTVQQKLGVTLEPEVKFLGEF
jgi:UDP-N-acetylmuramate dehydrogenase